MAEGKSQSAQYPARIIAGVAAAVILCLWGSFSFYEFQSAYEQQFSDPYMVAEQATRFAGFLEAVPQNAVLGYKTDAPPGSMTEGSMFLSAQYTLVPRLLDYGVEHEWVLEMRPA